MISFRKAQKSDIPLLIQSRLSLLRSANGLSETKDLSHIAKNLQQYYESGFDNNLHTAFLAFDGKIYVGTGGMCYYQVLPTFHNPTGWKAYVINMYTREEYRKQGIASKILDLLVSDSLSRGIEFITLEATNMGRPIYEKYGFAPMSAEMQLKNETYS